MSNPGKNHVISRSMIRNFLSNHDVQPATEKALNFWYRTVKGISWGNFADVKATFSSADVVGRRIVFDIGGHKLRIIARVNYQHRRVHILHVLTHAEYDRGGWKE